MKNIYFLSFSGSDVFVPVLWPSVKTFYEKYGKNPSEYNWISPSIEFYEDIDFIKAAISKNPPSIFGVSLYVWNFEKSLSNLDNIIQSILNKDNYERLYNSIKNNYEYSLSKIISEDNLLDILKEKKFI
jgi:hypothetical protein